MIDSFSNGMGAVFVLNLMAWMQLLAMTIVVFGAVIGFAYAFRSLFRFG